MKTFVIGFGSHQFGTIYSYNSKASAQNGGNYGTIFSSAEELESCAVTSSQMVDVYNHHNPSAKITKFSDRATACKRILALAQAKAEDKSHDPRKEDPMNEIRTATKPESAGEKRGRSSQFNGKKLFPANGLSENPRRNGTSGHKSMSIILASPGITFEDFVADGGRAQDLRWDIAHNAVRVE